MIFLIFEVQNICIALTTEIFLTEEYWEKGQFICDSMMYIWYYYLISILAISLPSLKMSLTLSGFSNW